MKHILTSLFAVALLACSSAPKHAASPEPSEPAAPEAGVDPKTEPAGPVTVADSQLGLSKASVFDVPEPFGFRYTEQEPGGNGLQPRPFYIAPPVVPHQVADFLPISIEENGCLACHELGPASAPDDPTPIPPSHATDYRFAPGQAGDSVVGARWRCVACHLPRSDAPSLVGNGFPR